MKKSYIVDSTCNEMRIDRWIRLKIGQIPQGLIEKYLRLGKIKLNKKKIKSSQKIRTKDNKRLNSVSFGTKSVTVELYIEIIEKNCFDLVFIYFSFDFECSIY